MKIHVLTDNRARKRGFLAEHGLSLYLELPKLSLLFDTGQSGVFTHNAALMKLDLSKADGIVLSHGHYDHGGGLPFFPAQPAFPKIYAHRDAFAKKYALNPDGETCREIGIPWSLEDYPGIRKSVVLTGEETEIAPGIRLHSGIPCVEKFEKGPAAFYTDAGAPRSPDSMNDEQLLVMDTAEGLCIFSGCSHPGVISCLRFILERYPGRKIRLLAAGMHLSGASPERVQKTMQALRALEIETVIPLHCTGIFAISQMARELDGRCLPLCAGDSIEIQGSSD